MRSSGAASRFDLYYYGSAIEDGIDWASFGDATAVTLVWVLLDARLPPPRHLHVASTERLLVIAVEFPVLWSVPK